MTKATDILDAILLKAGREGGLQIPYSNPKTAHTARFKLFNRKRQVLNLQEKYGNLTELAHAAESISFRIDAAEDEPDAFLLVAFPKDEAAGMKELADFVGLELEQTLTTADLSKSQERFAKLFANKHDPNPAHDDPDTEHANEVGESDCGTPYYTREED